MAGSRAVHRHHVRLHRPRYIHLKVLNSMHQTSLGQDERCGIGHGCPANAKEGLQAHSREDAPKHCLIRDRTHSPQLGGGQIYTSGRPQPSQAVPLIQPSGWDQSAYLIVTLLNYRERWDRPVMSSALCYLASIICWARFQRLSYSSLGDPLSRL